MGYGCINRLSLRGLVGYRSDETTITTAMASCANRLVGSFIT